MKKIFEFFKTVPSKRFFHKRVRIPKVLTPIRPHCGLLFDPHVQQNTEITINFRYGGRGPMSQM